MSTKPRIIFWGTPEFAVPSLHALTESGLIPDLVVTAPDKPVGRKQILTASPIKLAAQAHRIPVVTPEKLKDFEISGNWDLFVVVAYGKIIPQRILDIPKRGILNVHPSLLPQHRGPAPIQSALLAGDTETGVCIMLLDAEMDHGPVLACEKYPIAPHETYTSLHDTLSQKGARLLAETVPLWIAGTITSKEQDHTNATFTKKITTDDGLIDFDTMAPDLIYRKIRALNPEPGAFAYFDVGGKKIRTKIIDAALDDGQLLIKTVQPEGKTPLPWNVFKKRL